MTKSERSPNKNVKIVEICNVYTPISIVVPPARAALVPMKKSSTATCNRVRTFGHETELIISDNSIWEMVLRYLDLAHELYVSSHHAHERHLTMGVCIDAPWNNELPGGVDHSDSFPCVQVRSHRPGWRIKPWISVIKMVWFRLAKVWWSISYLIVLPST